MIWIKSIWLFEESKIEEVRSLENTITEQIKEIDDSDSKIEQQKPLMRQEKIKHKQQEQKTNENNYFTAVKGIVDGKKKEKRLFDHPFDYDVGENHLSEVIYIQLKSSSKAYSSSRNVGGGVTYYVCFNSFKDFCGK